MSGRRVDSMEYPADRRFARSGEPADLAATYATMNDLLLHQPDTETLLRRISELGSSIVPGARCTISFEEEQADTLAVPPESRPKIPRQTQRDGAPPSLDVDEAAAPSDNTVSLPLVVDDVTIGALNLYADTPAPLSEADVERAHTFAQQAAIALALQRRESAHLELDDELQEALVTRSVIDQAMGVLMRARRISGREALRSLREVSQKTNRKVYVLAAELIMKMTGHPPERPRPLTPRRRFGNRPGGDHQTP